MTRPYVKLVPGEGGAFKAVIVQPPEEITFEEEEPITPAKRPRQQKVRKPPRQPQPRDPPKQSLPEPQSPLEPERATGPRNRGLAGNDTPGQTSTSGVPQGADTGEIADQIGSTLGRAVPQLLAVANARAQAQVRGLRNRYAQGERVTREELQRAGQSLVGAERQSEYLGVDNPAFWQSVNELGEVINSVHRDDVNRVLEAAARGKSVDKNEATELLMEDLALERQKELMGTSDATGVSDSAQRLNEIRRGPSK